MNEQERAVFLAMRPGLAYTPQQLQAATSLDGRAVKDCIKKLREYGFVAVVACDQYGRPRLVKTKQRELSL